MKIRLIEIGRDGKPARCPGHIPPAGRDAIEGTVNLYEAVGFEPPWTGYLGDRDGEIVGTCAFKSPPVDGRVEIAYATFGDHQGKGIATAMARQLIDIARTTDCTVTVFAQTLPVENASTKILRRLGFNFVGPVEHPDDGTVWEWELASDVEAAGDMGGRPGRTRG